MARPRSLRRFLQDLRANAFLDGYHAGLAVTIVLIAAGVVISYLALRRLPSRPRARCWCQAPRTRSPGRPAGRNWPVPGHRPRLTRLAASACQPGPERALSIHQVAPAVT